MQDTQSNSETYLLYLKHHKQSLKKFEESEDYLFAKDIIRLKGILENGNNNIKNNIDIFTSSKIHNLEYFKKYKTADEIDEGGVIALTKNIINKYSEHIHAVNDVEQFFKKEKNEKLKLLSTVIPISTITGALLTDGIKKFTLLNDIYTFIKNIF